MIFLVGISALILLQPCYNVGWVTGGHPVRVPLTPKGSLPGHVKKEQEGQHPLTGQRAPPISGGTSRRRRTVIDGNLESPFPTACLL